MAIKDGSKQVVGDGFSVSQEELDLMLDVAHLTPLHDWVLVRKNFNKGKFTKSGLMIKTVKEERPKEGWVISVGAEVTDVRAGDYVHFPMAAGSTFEYKNQTLSVIKQKDINGVFTND